MKILRFRGRVLGKVATARLKQRQVTQTIRSKSSTPVIEGWATGDEVEVVFLYPEPWAAELVVGTAKILAVEPVNRRVGLTVADAWKGGFDTKQELVKALKRAGYRFMPLEEYELYKVRFQWIEVK